MAANTYWLPDDLLDYMRRVSVREAAVLSELREETSGLEMSVMQISPEQGNFMQLLVRLIGAERCLEIGVFTGYSALAVALALPENGMIKAFDISEEWTAIARRYWKKAGVDHKIALTLCPAREGLEDLLRAGEQGSYDFAFIDADKTGYPDYYELCLQLIRPGGLIVIDNTLWEQKVIDGAHQDEDTVSIRKLNAQIYSDDRVDQALLPLGDGITLVRKR